MARLINIDDVRARARRRLPRAVFDFIDGGAEDELTMRANRRLFQELSFRPHALVDVSQRHQSTTFFGRQVASPILLSAAGLQRLAHHEGEVAVARAAASRGIVFALSTGSSCSIEEVAAAAAGGPLWFQLYLWKDKRVISALVERAEEAGYHALCLTVDVPVVGRRERDLRNGMTMPPKITARNVIDTARHPAWIRGFLFSPPITFKNLEGIDASRGNSAVALGTYLDKELHNPGATWSDLEWLRSKWKGPLVVKGILSGTDARRCIDYGADGVVVSNHGGRQLDGAPGTLEVLSEVVEAVRHEPRVEVYIDGGIRRGSDIVKALAMGARGCLIGRPYVFGLAANGAAGVARVIDILTDEIDHVMALIGCPTLSEIDATYVRPPNWGQRANLAAAETLEA